MSPTNNCKGCPNRNTAEHSNPDCHTERCQYWAEYQNALKTAREQKTAANLAFGTLADGYTKRKISWARTHQHAKQTTKWQRGF